MKAKETKMAYEDTPIEIPFLICTADSDQSRVGLDYRRVDKFLAAFAESDDAFEFQRIAWNKDSWAGSWFNRKEFIKNPTAKIPEDWPYMVRRGSEVVAAFYERGDAVMFETILRFKQDWKDEPHIWIDCEERDRRAALPDDWVEHSDEYYEALADLSDDSIEPSDEWYEMMDNPTGVFF